MAQLDKKSFDSSEETRSFDKGKFDVVTVGNTKVACTSSSRDGCGPSRLSLWSERTVPEPPRRLRHIGTSPEPAGRRHRAGVRSGDVSSFRDLAEADPTGDREHDARGGSGKCRSNLSFLYEL
jgi:hypothetical protein